MEELKLKPLSGNVIRQGDASLRRYQLLGADVSGTATVRLMYSNFRDMAYEKTNIPIKADNIVEFSIDQIVDRGTFYLEIHVGDMIFPSRADNGKLNVEPSSLGSEANVIKIVGVDVLVGKVLNQTQGQIDAKLSAVDQSEATRQTTFEGNEAERNKSYATAENNRDLAFENAEINRSQQNTIVNLKNGEHLKYWAGSQAEYDAIQTKDLDAIYDIWG